MFIKLLILLSALAICPSYTMEQNSPDLSALAYGLQVDESILIKNLYISSKHASFDLKCGAMHGDDGESYIHIDRRLPGYEYPSAKAVTVINARLRDKNGNLYWGTRNADLDIPDNRFTYKTLIKLIKPKVFQVTIQSTETSTPKSVLYNYEGNQDITFNIATFSLNGEYDKNKIEIYLIDEFGRESRRLY